MNEEQAYLQYDSNDSVDAARRRRLYWQLFVTERFVPEACFARSCSIGRKLTNLLAVHMPCSIAAR
jgi:hypothetical protein